MATLIKVVVAVFVGVFFGLLITIRSLDKANSQLVAGPWHGAGGESAGGAATNDPYSLAANARAGLLPIGTSEGLSFLAETDSKGIALTGRCDYAVVGIAPPARFWTLSLLSPEGFPVQNPAARYDFTSSEALRMVDEPVTVSVSSEARSGNWLPTGESKHFVLMLRLYDTGLSTVGAKLEASAMPRIARLSCS